MRKDLILCVLPAVLFSSVLVKGVRFFVVLIFYLTISCFGRILRRFLALKSDYIEELFPINK